MKKILICLIILGLIGIIGLNRVNKKVIYSESEDNLYLFEISAIKFIKSQEDILPQFKNSKPLYPLIYKDKYGNERVIVFGVVKEEEIIGRIVINYDKDNPIFLEFAETPPPHLLDIKTTIISKISINENQNIDKFEYIYIFPLLFFIKFSIIEKGNEIKSLYFFWNEKRVVDFNEIPEYKNITKHSIIDNGIKGYYKILIDVPDYSTNNTPNLCNNCGPVAGANILGYWDKHGYPKLQLDGDEAIGSQLTTCLWYDMGTSCIYGTPVNNFKNGLLIHTNSCQHPPYNCCYNFTTSWQRPPSYNFLIIEINNNRPLGILFGWPLITPPHPNYGYHWVVGIGYAYGTNPSYYTFYIRSGWGEGLVILDYPTTESYIHGYVKIYPGS
jgi:hypothetical protein